MQALQHRADGKLYRIQTPQTPIARTKRYNTYKMDEFPSGMNMIVAVLAYTGGQQVLCLAVLPCVVWVAGQRQLHETEACTFTIHPFLEDSAASLLFSCWDSFIKHKEWEQQKPDGSPLHAKLQELPPCGDGRP